MPKFAKIAKVSLAKVPPIKVLVIRIPRGGTPYKISVAHLRAEKRGYRVVFVQWGTEPRLLQLGYIFYWFLPIRVFCSDMPYTVIPVYSGHLRDRKKVSAIDRCPLYRVFFKICGRGLDEKGSAKRVRYATCLCPCLGAFLKKHAETGYTYWPRQTNKRRSLFY